MSTCGRRRVDGVHCAQRKLVGGRVVEDVLEDQGICVLIHRGGA